MIELVAIHVLLLLAVVNLPACSAIVYCKFCRYAIATIVFNCKGQISLGSTRLDSTRLDTFDVSSPCILAVSS